MRQDCDTYQGECIAEGWDGKDLMEYSMQEHLQHNQRVKVSPGFGYGNERKRAREKG